MRTIKNSLILVMLFLTFNCDSLKKGLSEAVYIEYDQRINFDTYAFEKLLDIIDPNNSPENWNGITGIVNDGSPDTRGAWLIYQICSIKNNASKANNFHYDLSKFYVIYGGKKFYCKPLEVGKFREYPSNNFGATSYATPKIWTQFKNEVQTSPEHEVIVPNDEGTLSVSWRFAIYVTAGSKDPSDLKELYTSLMYDGNEPHEMLSRGQTPDRGNTPTHYSDLKDSCRPHFEK